ncbi:MAG: phosphoenolpyruvate--protein phosphotransferase [candidate division Zixibacteria bacterium]
MSSSNERVFKGVAASPGIIIGSTRSLSRDIQHVNPEAVDDYEGEIETFRKAIALVKKTLERIGEKVQLRLGPEFARIFEAQVMIAGDDVWNENIAKRIRKEKISAEYIYHDESRKVLKQLGNSSDAYLRERAQDIEAVTSRLVGRMRGEKKATLKGFKGATVVVARYLTPGDILGLSVRRNLGFATGIGGQTSHTALIAKSLSVPAVVGLGKVAEQIESGERVIIDGYKGLIIINPTGATLRKYRELKKSETQLRRQLVALRDKPSVTKDQFEVKILSNIELPNEVPKVLSSGASGIGLYRTEYLFLTRPEFPSFEEQHKTYSSILRRMGNKPVVIRTFDLGGDKFPGATGKTFDLNPFLGWRAIRVCLDRPDVFKVQLKALLKASRWGNLSIMIPMISNYEELVATKAILEECKMELRKEKVKFKEDIPLGIMIEIPSAAMIADHLAKEVDFFSIGTNDLTQYTLAVDRGNELLSDLYQGFHPSVLGLIKTTVTAAHDRNIKVSVCGEMAADPLGAVILAGLGVDELSVSFQAVGTIKKVIRSIDYASACQMADNVLKMRSHNDIKEYLRNEIDLRFPDLKPVVKFAKGNING